jgi:von Willebrand factor type A domain
MRTVKNLLLGTGAAGLIAAAVLAAPSGAKVPRAHAAACTKATNIEAIIDDSGSMFGTDPNTLRVKGLKLLINTLSPGTFLGAVEFGSGLDFTTPPTPAADTVFPPEAVGANASAMGAALDQKVMADNGGTDYNAAFAQADADNPHSDARIFLTDGGHNVGPYNNGHLAHNVPTYVIGFSPGLADPTDQARLQQIASDTHGQYFGLSDASQLQSVMNSVGSALTCQAAPKTFSDPLAQGQSKKHTLNIASTTRTIQIALTWSSPLDKFSISNLKLVAHGRVVAVGARHRKPRKLKVKTTTSPTFTLLKVSRLSKGKLSFKVKAITVGSGAPQVTLTTQVTQSSHK